MKKIQTEVLVIGGGATGTGILRDLAMRGIRCALVEKRDLSDGTTGRFHGLLHSGGRYVVKDPQAAIECIEENRILRKIMPHCIEDTGGFFIVTPWDDPDYADQFVNGCIAAGIPFEDVPIKKMLHEEPNLNPKIKLCYRVPDASADSFLASELNVESAKNFNARLFTYHEVNELLRVNDRVIGARCHDLVHDEEVEIFADLVVLAAGAWSGKISSTIGVNIQISPGKGTMIAVNHRIVNTVINRCKPPSDGDILVPTHSVSVMGTTDITVNDPDHYSIENWEISLLLKEGEKIIPGFQTCRILRAWAGVRPLYLETSATYNRDVSRAYVLLDHARRDGIDGLVTITSGKWTTYRKMAQITSDLVCEKLGIIQSCKTHLEELPGSSGRNHYLGGPLKRIEDAKSYGSLICECELATYADVVDSITQKDAKTIDDIRRDIRLGMGPCQGVFCSFRVTGIIHEFHQLPVDDANKLLFDFLRERWKGVLPVLYGSQLRQERFNELIYLNVLGFNQLPGLKSSRLGPTMYEPAEVSNNQNIPDISENATVDHISMPPLSTYTGNPSEVLVIGGGLSGLTSALITAKDGKKTKLITKGWSSLFWGSGCIDILGHSTFDDEKIVSSPIKKIEQLISQNPDHPYALVGVEVIIEAIEFIKQIFNFMNYPLHGEIEKNWLLPTSIGSVHPTCLAPSNMIAGDLNKPDPMLIIGIEGFHDFYPGLVCGNLISRGIMANHRSIKLDSLKLQRNVNSMLLARLFETEEFRDEVTRTIKPKLGRAERIGFPAVLGINSDSEVLEDLQEKLDCPVFEILGIPPSIPGIRLHNFLLSQLSNNGALVYEGLQVMGHSFENHELKAIFSEAASRQKPHCSEKYILATGGILGGGLRIDSCGEIHETALNIQIPKDQKSQKWIEDDFFNGNGHPIFRRGIQINQSLNPINQTGQAIFNNLYAIGSILGNCDPVREISSGGIALATAYKLGKLLSNS